MAYQVLAVPVPPLVAPITPRTTSVKAGTMTAILDQAEPAAVPVPRAYGYMRVPPDIPDNKVQRLERRVTNYAETKGPHFAQSTFEFHSGSHKAFDELVAELVRIDARFVVVPSLRQLAQNDFLQSQMLEQPSCTMNVRSSR